MSAAERFFDTNVLLYLLSGDRRKANAAERIIASGGVISVQVLNEFASVATKKLNMLVSDVREVLGTVRGLCSVQPFHATTHDLGLEVTERYRLSVCDAMIVAAASEAGCKVLYTEDLQHGATIAGVVIRNPFLSRRG